jgi:hypothetical protein
VNLTAFAIYIIYLFIVTSLILSLELDWRISLFALGLQYVGVFILVGNTWPLDMAVIKLVAGWIAAAVLGMEMVHRSAIQQDREPLRISGRVFRVILGFLVGLAALTFAPGIAQWMVQASYEQIIGGIFLIGMGVFYLGLSDDPFRLAIGLLTFLSGFEVFFAVLETSVIVAGFLPILTLGIAFTNAYLMAAPDLEFEK